MAENKQKFEKPAGGSGHMRGGFGKPKDLKATALRTFSYLTKRPLMLVAALISVILSSLSGVAGTYAMRPIINGLTDAVKSGSNVFPELGKGILLMSLVYVLMAATAYLQANLMAQLAQKGCNQLRKDLFNKLQELPLSYFDQHPHGQLMSRFTNDADNVQQALEQSVVQLLSSAISFVATVVMMLYLSPLLFIITAVVLVLTLFTFKKLGGLSRKFYREQQAALGAVNGAVQEDIEGLKVVKAFTREDATRAEFEVLNENYRVAASKATTYSMALMPISAQLNNVGYAISAVLGGVLSVVSGFDVGGLVSFLSYSKQISMPVNQISMQMTTVLAAMAGAERIFEVMDAEPEIDEGKVTLVQAHWDAAHNLCEGREPAGQEEHWAWKVPENGGFRLVALRGDVRFNDVCFGYVPNKEVLHHINVYAKPGQKIAFVGSTGAGKTTITNLINRFYEIQSGTITYDGINVKDIEKDSLRHSLGAVLQDTHLFTGTVMDNIRYGRLDATDEECIAAAKAANAHSFIRRLSDGYQTMVTGDGGNLSQGQRQLLAIARAAVADPPVMVLDEATSSIDTRTEALISKGMDTLMENRTVFVIAHRLSTIRNANAIAVIEAGEIIEKGNHQELLDQKGRYYQLYTGQFQLS
ncbi:MAG: ABC transporter ATP-binding protein [Oscillospiraceae bacterium]|nr:ABC transporter ATP-binding protein [Eubacteriales bacterium]MDY2618917.1 ABC transporter ATP-binding protein [Oscillospiraceae bacterium]